LGGVNSFAYPTNPVGWVDPLGLDAAAGVYFCKRPVNGKPGDKIGKMTIEHHYLCAVERDGDGTFPCYGFTTANPEDANGLPLIRHDGIIAGQDRGDYYHGESCVLLGKLDDKEAPKLLAEIAKRPPPTFAIGFTGTDCQEWAEETSEELHKKAAKYTPPDFCAVYPSGCENGKPKPGWRNR
jgi:hypothetical protein